MTRIAIAEDIPRVAQSLEAKLKLFPDFSFAFWAYNGADLLRKLEGSPVDLILMDIHMPEMDGIAATREVKARWPEAKVIMSTVFDDDEHIFQAILAGASGYLLKDEHPEALHRALHEALEGGAPMSRPIALRALQMLRNSPPPSAPTAEDFALTDRESEILALLADGLSYAQIGEKLFISYGTVRKHIEHIYRKLQVHNKVEAVNKARNFLGK